MREKLTVIALPSGKLARLKLRYDISKKLCSVLKGESERSICASVINMKYDVSQGAKFAIHVLAEPLAKIDAHGRPPGPQRDLEHRAAPRKRIEHQATVWAADPQALFD